MNLGETNRYTGTMWIHLQQKLLKLSNATWERVSCGNQWNNWVLLTNFYGTKQPMWLKDKLYSIYRKKYLGLYFVPEKFSLLEKSSILLGRRAKWRESNISLLIKDPVLSQSHNCDHYFTFASDNNSCYKYNKISG